MSLGTYVKKLPTCTGLETPRALLNFMRTISAALKSMQTIIAAFPFLSMSLFWANMWDERHGQHAEHQRDGSFLAKGAELPMEPCFGRFSGRAFIKASGLRRTAVGNFSSPDTRYPSLVVR